MWFYQRFRLPFSLLMGVVLAVGTVTSLSCTHPLIAGADTYIRVETEEGIYAIRTPVKVTPILVNQSDSPVTYTMAYVVKVLDAEETVIWEREMVVYGKITIPPYAEGRLDAFIWDQRDKDGNQISQGRYRIFIRLFEYRYRDIQGEKGITVR